MMTQKILNRDPKDEILKAFRLFDDDETGSCQHAALIEISFFVLSMLSCLVSSAARLGHLKFAIVPGVVT